MKRRDFDKLASASEYLKIYLPKEVSMPYNTNIDFDVDRIKWLFDSKKQHDIWYRIHNIKPEIFPKDVPLDEIYLIIAERNQSMPSTIDRSLLLPLA
ncbi:MAG: hypothetical protein KC505_10105 [Myxococcales bacterium]|nr:hypothetical protein [Myxococcales bacterium]